MAKLDLNFIDTFNDGIAKTAMRFQELEQQHEQLVAAQRIYEQKIEAATIKTPMHDPLKELVDTIKSQNGILSKQVELLKEENDRQKESVLAARAAEEARKEAKHSRIFNWVTFGVASAFSLAALIISIISLVAS